MLVKTRLIAITCLLAGLVWAAPASAQSTSGALSGTVRAAGGGPVNGAVVQAHSESTGALRTGVTDEDGRYRIDLLSPGSWTVVARLADGGISTTRIVQMAVQQTIQLDFTVSKGPSERVTVTAERPLVDRMKTAGQLRVGGGEADALPLSGRVFTDLALLDSSVRQAAPGNYFGERGAVFVVNGQSGRSNSFLVDGLDNNDQVSGTSQNSFFSQQVIQEFVLLTHQYSAEFGRASGGLMNVVTKKGTNESSWDAFIQGTSADWNRTGEFVEGLPHAGTSQDAVRRFQVGATVGGPIRKDKAFYFVAFEHQESDDVLPYTGVDREGINGGRFVAPSDDDNLFVRADFNFGNRTDLMLRLSADDRSNAGVNVGGVFTPEAGFRIDEQDLQFAGTLNRIVAPHILSETRFLAATSDFEQHANSSRPGVSRPSGVFGGNSLNRQLRDEQRFQLVQNMTWMRKDHTFKFGVDVTHSRTQIEAAFNPNGNFIYNYDIPFEPGDCGEGMSASESLGHLPNGDVPGVDCEGEVGDDDGDGRVDELPNIYSYPLVFILIEGTPKTTIRDTRVGVFAQDRWELGPRWLLDYGLRYDFGTYELPSDARVDSVVPNGGAGRDADNVAPRFGFTFTPRPGGKTVIRGGAGVFYDKLVLAFPAVAAITSGTQIGLHFPQGFAIEITEKDIEERGIETIRNELFFAEQLTLRFSTGTELETPYTVQYNLGMERPVGRHAAFGVNLVRSQGYHLPLMKDLNPVSGLIRPGPCSAARIDPDLDLGIPCHLADPAKGSIAALVTEGRSWYSGLDLNWRWQREDSWFRASYTWSEAEDLGFDPLKGGIALPPDSSNIQGERGRSDGDRSHRFVISGQTNLFWGLNASAVLQLSSGVPFNVTTGQDDNVDGILTDRPVGVARNDGADTPRDLIDAVRDQPVVPLGDYGSLEEPSFFQVDLRVTKPLALRGGKANGQFFVQIFNLLDTDNEGLVEGRAISADFGRTISLAGPPRTLELGLRIGY